MSRRFLVSIHDVTPNSLDRVQQLFDQLLENDLLPVSLLVVPGAGWEAGDLDRLRSLVDAGAELAGHGWTHSAGRIRSLRHRLHSLVLSRDTAEHLALDRRQALQLMRDCHEWFGEHDLPEPRLYVPPAWAMGDVPREDLDTLPFRCFETLGGVYVKDSHRFYALPMVGYEVDTRLRAMGVRLWNRINLARAGRDRPLRLGIHPHDLQLLMARDLEALLAEGGQALSYTSLR